jgi:hypothetical protein
MRAIAFALGDPKYAKLELRRGILEGMVGAAPQAHPRRLLRRRGWPQLEALQMRGAGHLSPGVHWSERRAC